MKTDQHRRSVLSPGR